MQGNIPTHITIDLGLMRRQCQEHSLIRSTSNSKLVLVKRRRLVVLVLEVKGPDTGPARARTPPSRMYARSRGLDFKGGGLFWHIACHAKTSEGWPTA